MGNYRFRLSDMIPNAWFYKLKDMSSKTKNHTNTQNPNNKKHPPPPPTQQKIPQFSNPRHSYYFTTDPLKAEKLYSSPINPKSTDTQFPPYNLPRKSSKRRRTKISRTTIKSSSPKLSTTSVISAGCRTNLDSTPENSCSPFESSSPDQNLYEFLLPEFGSDPVSVSDPFESLSSWSSSCSCRISSSATDIIIDMDGNNDSLNQKFEKINGFDLIPELELPPILTKPPKFSDMISEIKNRGTEPVQFKTGSLSVKVVKEGRTKSFKEHKMNSSIRKSFSSSSGVKIRSNSPIIGSKKIQSYSRKTAVSSTTTKNSRFSEKKNISDSFAVVKSSFDPQRDFRESMVEMIIENNLRASKDLEELLACYLSLNSNEYHDLIVKVFEQIWFDLTESRL